MTLLEIKELYIPWFTNLKQTAQNRCQPLPAPYKRLQFLHRKHCLLFILQAIYLPKLSPHTSSQPIKSRVYQRPLYLLTKQIAHRGF